MMKLGDNPIEQTETIRQELKFAFTDVFKPTHDSSTTRDKGHYGIMYVSPSNAVKAALSVDRELLVLISTFEDQQARTIQTARDLIVESDGRLDTSTFIVVHRDNRGNTKLKRWGREFGLAVLPIYFHSRLPSGNELLRTLAHELYSFDVFDVAGPVSDDLQFYGRRDEARNLARNLQIGQIRACFGIRKIGKTSILHRVINEIRENYDCTTRLIDAQRDAIFELDAARLLNSMAASLESSPSEETLNIGVNSEAIEVAEAAERLRLAVASKQTQVLFVFDEIDYLTPTSPTARHWSSEFNKFWRNVRAVYQATAADRKNLSLLISGVSSKWFSEGSIQGIENAALAFVPEEYLLPLERGASAAMIRRLGRTAGLTFSEQIADYIAGSCADMPFWIRKACSYIHNRIEIGLRPFQPQQALVQDYISEFVESDGIAMAEVALSHLFNVYPELRPSTLACAAGKWTQVDPRSLRTLEKYGIIRARPSPAIGGNMIARALALFPEKLSTPEKALEVSEAGSSRLNYSDWADELAVISRRRNILERKLRGIVANFLRASSLTSKGSLSPKERVLKCVDEKRRAELQRFELDEVMGRLYWLELIAVVKKEWSVFDRVFGDRAQLDSNATVVNERPDAHAKDLDQLEILAQRKAIGWLEDRLTKID